MKKICLSIFLTFGFNSIYAANIVENALIADTKYTIMGTFGTRDFAGKDSAFDWAFTMLSTGNSYQLQGISPTDNDVFGWKEVSITVPSAAWYMFQLNGDIDGDGSKKFDWVLVSTNMNNKAAYKLSGVAANGTFQYSSKLNVDYQIFGNSIHTGIANSFALEADAPGNVSISSDVKVNAENYNKAAENYTNSLEDTMRSVYNALEAISSDYTKEVTAETIDIEEANEFYTHITATIPSMARTILYNRDLIRLENTLPSLSQSPQKRGIFLFAAGLAVGGYALYNSLTSIIEKSNDVGKRKIERVTEGSTEHQNINRALNLDPNTSKQKTFDTYNSLGINEKTETNREIISDAYENADSETVADYTKTTAENSRDLGEFAVTTTVGSATSATGGQLVDTVAELFGASTTTASFIDLAVSAASIQPLDLLAASVTLQESSNETKEVTIPKPQESVNTTTAVTELNTIAEGNLDNLSAEEIVILFYAILQGMLEEGSNATKNADGSMTVDVPERTYLFNIKDLKNGDNIKVLNLEDASFIVTLAGFFPEFFDHMTLSHGNVISLQLNELVEDDTPTDTPSTNDKTWPTWPAPEYCPETYNDLFYKIPIDEWDDYYACYYHDNHNLSQEIKVLNGKDEGISKRYYENGVLSAEFPKENGLREGTTKTYYENANLKQTSEWKNNLLDGYVKDFDESGNETWCGIYSEGEFQHICE